jgi:hypothetical protein
MRAVSVLPNPSAVLNAWKINADAKAVRHVMVAIAGSIDTT